MLLTRYCDTDISVLGLKVPKSGFLIAKDPIMLIKAENKSQLPVITR